MVPTAVASSCRGSEAAEAASRHDTVDTLIRILVGLSQGFTLRLDRGRCSLGQSAELHDWQRRGALGPAERIFADKIGNFQQYSWRKKYA